MARVNFATLTLMTSSPGDALATIIRFADDLPPFWRALMGPWDFDQRSVWVAIFDDDGRPMPVLVPVDGLPEKPGAEGHLILERFAPMAIELGAGSMAFLLARPGRPMPTDGDRDWAGVLDESNNELPVRIWPTFLATKGRITPLRPIGQ